MTHRERMIVALERGQPDFVPHFELVFFETERDFGGRTMFGPAFQPDIHSALRTQRVCDAVLQSAESRSWEDIP